MQLVANCLRSDECPLRETGPQVPGSTECGITLREDCFLKKLGSRLTAALILAIVLMIGCRNPNAEPVRAIFLDGQLFKCGNRSLDTDIPVKTLESCFTVSRYKDQIATGVFQNRTIKTQLRNARTLTVESELPGVQSIFVGVIDGREVNYILRPKGEIRDVAVVGTLVDGYEVTIQPTDGSPERVLPLKVSPYAVISGNKNRLLVSGLDEGAATKVYTFTTINDYQILTVNGEVDAVVPHPDGGFLAVIRNVATQRSVVWKLGDQAQKVTEYYGYVTDSLFFDGEERAFAIVGNLTQPTDAVRVKELSGRHSP